MIIFGVTILLITLHKRFELLLNLEENTLLIMGPVISAGLVMLYRRDRARFYVEREVEWNSLLFFMFLFGQAGVIHASGVGSFLAGKIVEAFGHNPRALIAAVLFSNGLLSSLVDNVVAVAAYIPLIQNIPAGQGLDSSLWWALLFGACFGGNITMIGSTANIVAIGLLEKRLNTVITFSYWLKIGLTIGVVSMTLAMGMIMLLHRL